MEFHKWLLLDMLIIYFSNQACSIHHFSHLGISIYRRILPDFWVLPRWGADVFKTDLCRRVLLMVLVIPYTLHLIPYTLHLIPRILYHILHMLCLIFYTLYVIPYILYLISYTLHFIPQLHLLSYTLYLTLNILYLILNILYLVITFPATFYLTWYVVHYYPTDSCDSALITEAHHFRVLGVDQV